MPVHPMQGHEIRALRRLQREDRFYHSWLPISHETLETRGVADCQLGFLAARRGVLTSAQTAGAKLFRMRHSSELDSDVSGIS
jgi:hypothetical protein